MCLYAPVNLLRHLFWTLYKGAVVITASGFPSPYILHSCDPYRRVGLITAVYKSQELRAEGPYITVIILNRASEAASPLQAACDTCSFQVSPGSSYTPRTLITFSYIPTWWVLTWTVNARSLYICYLCLIKWIS